MNTLIKLIASFNRRYCAVLKFLLTLVMGLMIIPVSVQILSRYLDFLPRYIWTEEAARFFFVWMIMIGSIIAVREGAHFDVDLFPNVKSVRIESFLRIIVHVLMLLLALVFIRFGYDFARTGYVQSSEMIGINMLSLYIAFPMAGFSWFMLLLEKLIEDFIVLKTGKPSKLT